MVSFFFFLSVEVRAQRDEGALLLLSLSLPLFLS
jgi:hypothetical protein